MRRLRDEAATALVAVQFLTRAPVPSGVFTPERQAAAVRYYPLVGALVGLVGAAALFGAALLLPEPLPVLVSLAATLLFTGAFHEDGLADTADGIGGGVSPERSLEIMKDSRIGTYGAAALGLALGIKTAALASMDPISAALALLAGHTASRGSAVLAAATSRYVRDAGTAKFTAESVSGVSLAVALLISVAALALLGAGAWAAAIGLGLGHLAARAFYERKLGGYTGDCLGAVQQLSELGLYLGLLAWL